jgi:5-formyltetrahydrofolate cyclo-ligase
MKAVIIQSMNELQLSSFGILEPEDFQNSVDPKEIDLLFIPGLAFDKKGGRIGYGAGYYDRYLKTVREDAYKVGLAYDFQIIPSVPMETYDTFIDDIIAS